MASLASSIETSLGLPKKTPTPFKKLTEAVILSRRHRSFAYYVEDQQPDDVDDLNLLLCVHSIMKLVEEFEDTSTHGLCNYRDAAIEVTKVFIVEGSKHYCQKVSTLVKKQLLAKLAAPGFAPYASCVSLVSFVISITSGTDACIRYASSY